VFSSGLYIVRDARLSRSSCIGGVVLSINVFVTVVILEGDDENGSKIEEVPGDVSRSIFGIELEPS